MVRITKSWLKKNSACDEAVNFMAGVKEKNPIKLIRLALEKREKLEWASWLIMKLLNKRQKIKYAIFAAEQVLYIFERKFPDDKRPRLAIEAAKIVLESNTKKNRLKTEAAAKAAVKAAEDADAAAKKTWARLAVEAMEAAEAAYIAAWVAEAAVGAADSTWVAVWTAATKEAVGEAAGAAVGAAETKSKTVRISMLKYGLQLLEVEKRKCLKRVGSPD